jgi:hypothetical protein
MARTRKNSTVLSAIAPEVQATVAAEPINLQSDAVVSLELPASAIEIVEVSPRLAEIQAEAALTDKACGLVSEVEAARRDQVTGNGPVAAPAKVSWFATVKLAIVGWCLRVWFKVCGLRSYKVLSSLVSAAAWTYRKVVLGVSWCIAVVTRLVVDIDRRRQICQAITAPASAAVLRSTTLRLTYAAATGYCLYKSFMLHDIVYFEVGCGLALTAILAETVWQVILTTAAIVGRMDTELDLAVKYSKSVAAKVAEKAEAVVAAVPVRS